TRGHRGLPGGTSLARLLAQHRGKRNPKALPRLSLARILAWADAHSSATGRWPSGRSGPVRDAPGEDWAAINQALIRAHGGRRGGPWLARLLAGPRPSKRRRLTLARIRAWAEAQHRATGRWPDAQAGPVRDVTGEAWGAIDSALRRGGRGLAGGRSLRRLF